MSWAVSDAEVVAIARVAIRHNQMGAAYPLTCPRSRKWYTANVEVWRARISRLHSIARMENMS